MQKRKTRPGNDPWICTRTVDGREIWLRVDYIVSVQEACAQALYVDVRMLTGEAERVRGSMQSLARVVFENGDAEEDSEE